MGKRSPIAPNYWYVDFGNGSTTGYYAITAWHTPWTPTVGTLTRPTAPAVGNELAFVCVTSGAVSGTQPTWTNSVGSKNTDGSAVWIEVTGLPAVNGDITNTWQWASGNAVAVGTIAKNVAGTFLFIVSTLGTGVTTATEPSWNTTTGATTTDSNSNVWTCLGSTSAFSNWAAPHARLANLPSYNGFQTDVYYVANEHAETSSSAITINFNSSSGSLGGYCYSVSKTTVPPVAVTAGASISTTGVSDLTLQASNTVPTTFEGFTFNAGSSSNTANLVISQSSVIAFKSCALQLNNTSASSRINMGTNGSTSQRIYMDNCTVKFGSTSQTIQVYSFFRWTNTASAIQGATFPTNLFTNMSGGFVEMVGVDLSALGSGKTISGFTGGLGVMTLTDCKLGSSVTVSGTPSLGGCYTLLSRCDSAAAITRNEVYHPMGTLTTETTLVMTGGASDGVTPVSWKVTTNSGCNIRGPFESLLRISKWNLTTGSTVTATIEFLADPRYWSALPTNAEIWADIEYLSSSGSPLGTYVSGAAASLATGSALTASSQAWDSLATARANSTAYSLGQAIKLASNPGRIFICTTAGTSAGSEPGGYSTAVDGGAVTDGSATFKAAWRCNIAVSLSSPGLAGPMNAIIKCAKTSAVFYANPALN